MSAMDQNIARGRALIQETRRHAQAMWQEVGRSQHLLRETRKLLDSTKLKAAKPNRPS